MDGSQKLPQRMLDGIRMHLERNTARPLLALGVAGWMRYVSGTDDRGNAIDVRDPLSDKFQAIVASSSDAERVSALLTLKKSLATTCRKTLSLSRQSPARTSASSGSARVRPLSKR